jgi:two-component system chemotaxis response regulator CheY
MRFLVVDDSSLDRHLLASLLRGLGYEIDEVANPQGLLPQIATQNYTALFVDIVMPEQDGYKFVRSLRAEPTTAQQYVVFYSHKQTPLEINYGLKQAGANDYLLKPANQDSLRQILARIPGVSLPLEPMPAAPTQEVSSASEQPQIGAETEISVLEASPPESATGEKAAKKYRGVTYAQENLPPVFSSSKPAITLRKKYRGIDYQK